MSAFYFISSFVLDDGEWSLHNGGNEPIYKTLKGAVKRLEKYRDALLNESANGKNISNISKIKNDGEGPYFIWKYCGTMRREMAVYSPVLR